MSFTELAPKLLNDGLEYVLSEVFSQDPLEAYFSRQRHRGGSCDNPTVPEHCFSSAAEGGVQGLENYECGDQQHTTDSK